MFCLQVLGFDEDHKMWEEHSCLVFVKFSPFPRRMAHSLNMIIVSRKVLAFTSLRYRDSVTIPRTTVLTSELLGFLLEEVDDQISNKKHCQRHNGPRVLSL